MLLIGLTGGIGSGKSTVAAALAARGAAVIDADRIAREVVEPGGPAYAALVNRFGSGVLQADGRLDRPALAGVVFADRQALSDLNAITHPVIAAVIAERVAALSGGDRIVVIDIPLLDVLSKERHSLAAVVVVDTPERVAVERLVRHRGFSGTDAWARVKAQISREERRSMADLVIDNAGDRADLEQQVDRAWTWLQGLARAG